MLAALCGVFLAHPATAAPAPSAPKIIIKLDDLKSGGGGTVGERWTKVVNFLKERKIKANIGIICDSLESDKGNYIPWIKEVQQTGLVEFWLHAYDHKVHAESDGYEYAEFQNRPYEEQKRRFELSQKLATEKLGFPFRTFGPPGGGNAQAVVGSTNTDLYRVVQEDPAIKVWLYSSPMNEAGHDLEAQGKVTILDRVWQVNIEHPLFKPNAEALQNGYLKYASGRQYFVIQGHPNHWDDNGFAEFVKMIDFMTQQGCEFVKASEYVASIKPSSGTNTSAPPRPKPAQP